MRKQAQNLFSATSSTVMTFTIWVNSCHAYFYPFNLQHSSCKHVFSIRMEGSVDPDQMASSEAS